MQASDIFEGAADYIERYGHNRGHVGDKQTGFCIIGAISEFAHDQLGDRYDGTEAWQAAYANIDDYVPGPMVVEWSDSAPTQELIDTLRKAAKAERIKEEARASQ